MLKETENVRLGTYCPSVQVYENSAKPIKATPELEEKYNLGGRVRKMQQYNYTGLDIMDEAPQATKSALSNLPSKQRRNSYVLAS